MSMLEGRLEVIFGREIEAIEVIEVIIPLLDATIVTSKGLLFA